MKKLLSALLSLTMITALASTAFAAEPSTAEYAFSNDVVYAEISNGDLNTYSNSSIIVMTKEQASELGTKLQDIAMSCELVYITNATDTSEIAEIAGLPAPGLAVSTAPEKTQTIAVAIDNIDGDLFIKNISVISDDIDALLNTSSRQSDTVLLDGIEAALNEDEVINRSLNIGPSVSWNYDSDAMTVTNSFSEEDRRIWYFEPKKINTGDAVVQEPGIRSTSSTKASQYTTVNMHCPIYNFLGLIVGSNDMGYHIYWN